MSLMHTLSGRSDSTVSGFCSVSRPDGMGAPTLHLATVLYYLGSRLCMTMRRISFLLILGCFFSCNTVAQDCQIGTITLSNWEFDYYEPHRYVVCSHGTAECFDDSEQNVEDAHDGAKPVRCPEGELKKMVHSETQRRLSLETSERRLWEGGVMCYDIKREFNPEQYQLLYDAMKHYELMTNVRFLHTESCKKNKLNQYCDGCVGRVSIGHAGGNSQNCNSTVGDYGSASRMFLGNRCFNADATRKDTHGITLHEIGHSLGFYHEQQHPEANLIHFWDTIPTSRWSSFRARTDLSGATYDPYSIMHYPSYIGFCIPNYCVGGEPVGSCVVRGTVFCTLNQMEDCVMPTRDHCNADLSRILGQRRFLSRGDIVALRRMYPKAAWSARNSYIDREFSG